MATTSRPHVRPVNPDIQRLPPHNFEAEMCLLGAILSDNRALEVCEDFLEPEHFADFAHQRIYDAARTMIRRGAPASATTMRQLMTEPEFAPIGGPEYLARLADNAISIVGVVEYAKLILDMAARRALLDAAAQMVEAAHDGDLERTGWALAEEAAGALDKVAAMRPGQRQVRSFDSGIDKAITDIEDAYRRGGALVGKPTGVHGLDKFLGGLFDSDLTIIGGRSGQGKTVLAIAIAMACARAGTGVAFFSLEMSYSQIVQRVLAQETGVTVSRQRKGWVRDHEWPALREAKIALHGLPIAFEDDGGQSIETIRARARKLKYRQGAGIVIIDHLQCMTWSPGIRDEKTAMGHITAQAKAIAKDLALPVVLLSQVNRDVAKRDNPRPTMGDLTGSGMIEANADNILLLYRPGYYAARRSAAPIVNGLRRTKEALAAEEADAAAVADDTAEIIIGKNRHGGEATITVGWDGPRTRFIDRDAEDDDEPEGLFERG